MSKTPKSVLWPLKPHSRGKHIVLQRYIKEWLRIVGTGGTNLQIIDGFAGPGEYAGGTAGSPVLLLEEAMRAPAPRGGMRITFLFIERNKRRVGHLTTLLAEKFTVLPPHVRYGIVHGEFTDIEKSRLIVAGKMAPSFTMVDPFGVSQTPMRVIAQLLKNKSSEVYVSLMADHVARFSDDPNWEARLTALYGTDEWKVYQSRPDHDLKRFGLRLLYEYQLKQHGAKYVVSFDLYHGKVYKYSIVFGTSHPLGCGLMKTQIWNCLGGTEYIASRSSADQLTFDLNVPLSDRQPERELLSDLRVTFRGRTVFVDELDAWMHTDAHIYAPKHLRLALPLLEAAGEISVVVPPDCQRRGLTYPKQKGYAITFTA